MYNDVNSIRGSKNGVWSHTHIFEFFQVVAEKSDPSLVVAADTGIVGFSRDHGFVFIFCTKNQFILQGKQYTFKTGSQQIYPNIQGTILNQLWRKITIHIQWNLHIWI